MACTRQAVLWWSSLAKGTCQYPFVRSIIVKNLAVLINDVINVWYWVAVRCWGSIHLPIIGTEPQCSILLFNQNHGWFTLDGEMMPHLCISLNSFSTMSRWAWANRYGGWLNRGNNPLWTCSFFSKDNNLISERTYLPKYQIGFQPLCISLLMGVGKRMRTWSPGWMDLPCAFLSYQVFWYLWYIRDHWHIALLSNLLLPFQNIQCASYWTAKWSTTCAIWKKQSLQSICYSCIETSLKLPHQVCCWPFASRDI